MRVVRSLDKLRDWLQARGISTAGEALAAALTTYGVQATPPALAASLTASALAAGASTTGTLAGIITMSKVQVVVFGAVLATTVLAPMLWQRQINRSLRRQNQTLASEVEALRASQAEVQSQLLALDVASTQLRNQERQLGQLRSALARLNQQQTPAAKPGGSSAQPQPAADNTPTLVTDAEVAAFLQRPKHEQGELLGHLRRQGMGLETRPDAEFVRNRALATTEPFGVSGTIGRLPRSAMAPRSLAAIWYAVEQTATGSMYPPVQITRSG